MSDLKNELQALRNHQASQEREFARKERELKATIDNLRTPNGVSEAFERLAEEPTKQTQTRINSSNLESPPNPLVVAPGSELAKGPVVKPHDVPFAQTARELIDQRLELLARHPAPSVRVEAVEQLGDAREFVDVVAPALLSAYRSDASEEARSAIIVAFGELKNLGNQKEIVSTFLNNVVQTAKQKEDQVTAAESLISIDANSPYVKSVLRITLLGGSKPPPRPSRDIRSNSELNSNVRDNRIWACRQLQNDEMNGEWAIGLLIVICEIEAQEVMAGRMHYELPRQPAYADYSASIDHCLAALMHVGRNDPRVRAHLARYANIELAHSENAADLRVKYDSLLKELE